jgi:two-component system sensor histidine kinase CreC
MRWPKIPLGLRLFAIYFLLVVITAYMVTTSVTRELKPAVRQTTEETLVDMANALAVMLEDYLVGDLNQAQLQELLVAYQGRDVNARIWEIDKAVITNRIYVTNQQGIVIADSWQQDIGKDYSQWNDVYLTLRGQYGARSTIEKSDDPSSTVMHVAAPIYHQGEIIGSVTVAKANRTLQPFIDLSQQNVLLWMIGMSALVLVAGALFAWRIHSALHRLEHFALEMGRGNKVKKPSFRIFYEYQTLSDALQNMREKLDGKQYVEEYVETLTHELKSPLSAIKGASEILQQPLSAENVARFAGNIERESDRMQSLIEQLLQLARLEKRPQLEQSETINISDILHDVLASADARLMTKAVDYQVFIQAERPILGDRFLIQQALFNLLDNALDFVSYGGKIHWTVTKSDSELQLSIFNTGSQIPDYALSRLTERFYSLPRENGIKSTGLGLNFVDQIMKLHHGSLKFQNENHGVRVSLVFPSP